MIAWSGNADVLIGSLLVLTVTVAQTISGCDGQAGYPATS